MTPPEKLRRAPRPCLDYFCQSNGYPEYNGRCRAHYVPWKGSNRRARLPRDWGARVRAVLQRDRGVCQTCGGTGADAADHITPGDDHSLSNLAAIHQDVPPFCHRTKSAREGAAAANASMGRGNIAAVIERRVAQDAQVDMPWLQTMGR